MAETNDKFPESTPPRDAGWERQVLERLAFASLEEQRRARRWGIFRFVFLSGIVLLIFVLFLAQTLLSGKALASRYTALVDMEGVIASEEMASADNVVAGLRAAFEAKNTIGVVLRVNSPGGSPVQSRYIYDEIKRLRDKYPKTPLYAVIGDMCASGCYYVVAAADKIYANRGSLVGSIGVLMNGFGFTEAMKKLGIERRLLTAGEYKGFLDPFGPMKPEERRHAQRLLDNIHLQFIEAVREGRGEALKESKQMFSGLFWTGDQAKDMGLVDEFGSASYVAREVIGAEEIIDFTFRENVFDRFAHRFGTAVGETLGAQLLGRTIK
jgi:protease-4